MPYLLASGKTTKPADKEFFADARPQSIQVIESILSKYCIHSYVFDSVNVKDWSNYFPSQKNYDDFITELHQSPEYNEMVLYQLENNIVINGNPLIWVDSIGNQ